MQHSKFSCISDSYEPAKKIRDMLVVFCMILVSQFLLSGQSIAASTSSTYTREAFLPYLSSAFYAPATGTSAYFGTNFINPNAIPMTGVAMPPELIQDMSNGEVVRVKVLIPPGANYADITVDTGQAGGVKWGVFTKDLPYCTSQPSNGLQTCISPEDLGAPTLISATLYPFSGATGTNSSARYVYFVLQAGAAGFRWANITMSMNINNVDLYTSWRNARSWAGATTGDCDGLGTTNCTASSSTPTCISPQVLQNGVCVTPMTTCTSPQVLQNGVCVTPTTTCTSPQVLQNGVCVTPTTAFSLTPTSQQVAAGAIYTLGALNGTISSCQSFAPGVFTDPTVAIGGLTATGNAAVGAAANSSATIACLSTTGELAKATLTVAAPPVSLSFTTIGINKLSNTSATIMATASTSTASTAITGYWVAIPYTGTALATPSAAQVKAGQDASGKAEALKGSAAMFSGIAKEFSLSGLTANTSYQVFVYAEDASGNGTSVDTIALVTNTDAVTPATISVTSSGANANLVLAATVVTASNAATGTKNYYVAALLPGSLVPPAGAIFFLTKAGGWEVWKGGALLPYQTPLTNNTINILDGKLDVTSLIGTDFYAGYGVGDELTIKKIYTVK